MLPVLRAKLPWRQSARAEWLGRRGRLGGAPEGLFYKTISVNKTFLCSTAGHRNEKCDSYRELTNLLEYNVRVLLVGLAFALHHWHFKQGSV